MAYTRTNWVSGETPLSAANMNNIEDGIEEIKNTVGTVYNSSSSTSSSVAATGYKTIATLSLPTGIYIVTGHIRWASIPAGRLSIAVGTGSQPGAERDGVQAYYTSSAVDRNLAMQTSAILNLGNDATVYLSAYADSNATVSHGIISAVRIK